MERYLCRLLEEQQERDLSLKRSAYFIFSRHASGDLVAAELVLGMRNRFPLVNAYGVGGAILMRTGVVHDMAVDLGHAATLSDMLDAYLEKASFQMALLIGHAQHQKEWVEVLQSRGIAAVHVSLDMKDALDKREIELMRRGFQHVLCVFPHMRAALSAVGIGHSYIGFPYLNRVSKVIVDLQTLGFSQDTRILCLPCLTDRISEIGYNVRFMRELVERIAVKDLLDLRCVMVLPSNISWKDLHAALPELAGKVDGAGFLHHSANFTLTIGKKREILSLSQAALVASDLDSLECTLVDVPHMLIKGEHFVRDFCQSELPVNLFGKRRVVAEHALDEPQEKLAKGLRSLITDERERKAARTLYRQFRESLSPYSDDVAMEVFEEFFVKQRSPRLVD